MFVGTIPNNSSKNKQKNLLHLTTMTVLKSNAKRHSNLFKRRSCNVKRHKRGHDVATFYLPAYTALLTVPKLRYHPALQLKRPDSD